MCKALNYFENFLVFRSTFIGCVSISTFTPLVGVPVGVTSSCSRIKHLCNHYRNKKIRKKGKIVTIYCY